MTGSELLVTRTKGITTGTIPLFFVTFLMNDDDGEELQVKKDAVAYSIHA